MKRDCGGTEDYPETVWIFWNTGDNNFMTLEWERKDSEEFKIHLAAENGANSQSKDTGDNDCDPYDPHCGHWYYIAV